MLPELLAKIPAAETIVAVSGDGAYDTPGWHAAIAVRGAAAWIPTRKNAQYWKENTACDQVGNDTLRTSRYLRPNAVEEMERISSP